MKQFWEASPEWQRQEALRVALESAQEAMHGAGARILSAVQIGADARESALWLDRRTAYLDAVEVYGLAAGEWKTAYDAFACSSIGQARARALKDPLAQTEQEAA